MRTPRVFNPDAVSTGERIELPSGEGRHLSRVLRRRVGDAVQLLTPIGKAFVCRIADIAGDGRVTVEVGREVSRDELSVHRACGIAVTLGLAVVRGQAFELALRMATELGVHAVVPLFTARTVVRWDEPAQKRQRYERIAREAAKQCGRLEPLRLEDGVKFRSWLEGSVTTWERTSVPRWIAVPGASLPHLPRDLGPQGSEVLFAVGPEGGFTEEEVRAALASGWTACGFPTPVLRTPTAVALIAALGLLWPEL